MLCIIPKPTGGYMAKLWQKDHTLNELVERFTVGTDYLLDVQLVPSDCVASLAHAVMLEKIGILTNEEVAELRTGLLSILSEADNHSFHIRREDEDCHTAIENRLTTELGEVGKKIHTGRSRNDQVIAALRLYARSRLTDIGRSLLELSKALTDFAERFQDIPMPGRTHMQIAMPSSVGLWAASFAELLLDDGTLIDTAYVLNNRSPLGSAASYGVPLPLDREMVAWQLGFAGIQNNVLAVNNSRGKLESIVLDALDQIGLTLGKFAEDLIIFSMPEFGYFSLPADLCSGSSIMPQKRNPDGLELLRARSGTLHGAAEQVKAIVRSLPSGYNRDFQETKEPFLRGLQVAYECIQIARLTIERLEVHPDRLRAAFTPEIFATDAAIEKVRSGMSFRDAYREVGKSLSSLVDRDPDGTVSQRTSSGTAGNLRLESVFAEIAARTRAMESEERRVAEALSALAGVAVRL